MEANQIDHEKRVVRILMGLCPMCDRTDHHTHGSGDMTSQGKPGDWTYLTEAEVQEERARRKAKRARK